jgi:eukaryotic-like serine/threonine-protein kinase
MSDDSRVRDLVEEILESERTPEEVCAKTPDLLPAVRERLEQMQRLDKQLDEWFSDDEPTNPGSSSASPLKVEFPVIPGYEVEAVLGRGGMGVVFRAKHVKLNRTIALKMLLAGAYAAPEELARFRREAQAVAVLRHPNIVQVYDAGEITGRPFFTMEFVEGGTLARQMAANPFPPRRAAETVAVLASAVQFAHKSGFIHRDIKPVNILMTPDGMPKITDFGLVRSIEAGTEITQIGARVGTPTYMAPEQAAGNVNAIGPSVDIYALGALLYEMLTGKPPLEGKSPTETLHKVLSEDPPPLSGLNAKVPRDLETICLKCLQKDPARRYASAQDLCDDLHRFLDGKPVLARPIGVLERGFKWARRRPTIALLVAVLAISLTAAAVTGVVLWRQADERAAQAKVRQERACAALETAIQQAYEATLADRWDNANRILESVAVHLVDADSDQLNRRFDRAKQEIAADHAFDNARQEAVRIVGERSFMPVAYSPKLEEDFRKAFTESPYNIDGPEEETAAQIRSSTLVSRTAAALDFWAFAALLEDREELQKQLLKIAQLADPDPVWGDRFRTPANWHNKKELHRLADDAFNVATLPPSHQLSITAALLGELGEMHTDVQLMFRGRGLRPGDFWSNFDLACMLTRHARHRDAAVYYRVAGAVRPKNVDILNRIGASLVLAREMRDGIDHFMTAIDLEPKNGMLRHGHMLSLIQFQAMTRALDESQQKVDAAPDDAWRRYTYGVVLSINNRNEEAVIQLQKAIQLNFKGPQAQYQLGNALEQCGRLDEASAAFRDAGAFEGHDGLAARRLGRVLRKLGKHEEAIAADEWIIREFDPKKRRKDRESDIGRESNYSAARLGHAESLMCLGRFGEAKVAAAAALKRPDLEAWHIEAMQKCSVICDQLAPCAADVAAFCDGAKKPIDAATHFVLAEWLHYFKRHTVAAVRVYESALADPSLSDETRGRHRFQAACAAALAGTGEGLDAAKLTDAEKATLRSKAREWLEVEYRRLSKAKGDDFVGLARQWHAHRELAGVREATLLAALPETERFAWQKFWDTIKPPLPDANAQLVQARAYVDRKEWQQAAEAYARFIKSAKYPSAEVCFEFANTQLLSGDQKGFVESCRFVVKVGPKYAFRGYLVARTCTLASDPDIDVRAAAVQAGFELKARDKEFWSLTEQGALHYRTRKYKEAVAAFQASLRAEPKKGAAVSNWLWLALAHHQLGEHDEARSSLSKATTWLDSLGNEMPRNADALGLHRHNWLEAHVLRREAEELINQK